MIEIFKYKNIINRFALLEKKTGKATPPPKLAPAPPAEPDNEDTPIGEPLKANIKPVEPAPTAPHVQGSTPTTAAERKKAFGYAASTAKGHEKVQKGVGGEGARTTPRVPAHEMRYPDDISKMLGTGVPSTKDEVDRLRADKTSGQTPNPPKSSNPRGRPRKPSSDAPAGAPPAPSTPAPPAEPTNPVGVQGAKGVETAPPETPVVPKPGEGAETSAGEPQPTTSNVDAKVKNLRDRLNKAKAPVTPAEGVKQDLKAKAPGGTPAGEAPPVAGTAPTGPPPPTGGGSEGAQQPKDPESDVTKPPAGKEKKKTVADDLKDKAKQPGSGVKDETPKEEPPPQETSEQKRVRVEKEKIKKEQEARAKAKKETMGAEEASKKAKTEKERIDAEINAAYAARSAERSERKRPSEERAKAEKNVDWATHEPKETNKEEFKSSQEKAKAAREANVPVDKMPKKVPLPKTGKQSETHQWNQRAQQVKDTGYTKPSPATTKKTRVAWTQHLGKQGYDTEKPQSTGTEANKQAVNQYGDHVADQTVDKDKNLNKAVRSANKVNKEKADQKAKIDRMTAKESRRRIKRNRAIRKGMHGLVSKTIPSYFSLAKKIAGGRASIGQGSGAAPVGPAATSVLGRR